MQVARSTCEVKYVALSIVLKEEGLVIDSATPKVHCKAFEENAGALELAKVPKMRPHTKHINAVYHHFQLWVQVCKISLH
eukprot:15365013-Ditylum_brightwellii.AAC.2